MDSVGFDVGEVTRLLRSARGGEPGALERLVPLVYEDLRRLARRQLGHEYGEDRVSFTEASQVFREGGGGLVAPRRILL